MVDQLIEGIGDEVVLFVAFLFLSICMLIYVSFKRDQAQQQQNESRMQERDVANTASSSTTLSDNRPNTDVINTAANQPSGLSSDQPHEHNDERSTIRARFPQSHGNTDESLSIRLILPNNTTLSVNVLHSTTLGEMRSTYFQEELTEHRPVRFIYQGRVLDNDTQTLQDLEIGSNHAIHVHIGRSRPHDTEGTQNFGPQPPGEMLDLSQLFLPLFGLIVAICWVCMFCFPNVFTLLTKILLFILSIVYMFLAYVTR